MAHVDLDGLLGCLAIVGLVIYALDYGTVIDARATFEPAAQWVGWDITRTPPPAS